MPLCRGGFNILINVKLRYQTEAVGFACFFHLYH